jgi:hypothetical protein
MSGWLLDKVLLLAVAAVCFYVVMDEPPFLSYRNLPFAVLTPLVKPGEPVKLNVVRCNSDSKTRVYGLSHRLLSVDGGTSVILPAGTVSIEPGCSDEISAINVIPPGTAPGLYIVEGYAEVQATLRSVSVRWVSQPFRVIP